MNINEKELAEAVDRLREGESVMGVSDDDIVRIMNASISFTQELLNMHLEKSGADALFEERFNAVAKSLLAEALRTHKEQEAGLM